MVDRRSFEGRRAFDCRRVRRRPGASIVTALLVALPGAVAAQDGRPTDAGAIADRLLHVLQEETGMPAFSSAVSVGDTVVWTGTAAATGADGTLEVEPGSRFRLASVSKLFTVTLALVLAEQGRLDLDADIRTYVPGWPDHDGAVITPRRLAAHVAGINHYLSLGSSDFDPRRQYDDILETLAFFDSASLLSTPGTEYSYSSFGYVLLAAAIASAAGQPFPEALDQLLLDPHGLHETEVEDVRRLPAGSIPLYRLDDRVATPITPENQSGFRGATGMRSTARDLVRFASAFLRGRIVGPALRDSALVPTLLADGRPAGVERFSVGFGWRVGTDWDGRSVAHHAGSHSGARSVLLGYPGTGAAVALLSNAVWTSRMETTAELIAAPFLDPAPARPLPCPVGAWPLEGSFNDEPELGRIEIRAEGALCVGTLHSEGGLAARFGSGSAARDFSLVRVAQRDGGHVFAMAYPWGLAQFRLRRTGDRIEATGDVVGWPLEFRAPPSPRPAR